MEYPLFSEYLTIMEYGAKTLLVIFGLSAFAMVTGELAIRRYKRELKREHQKPTINYIQK